MKRSRTHTLGVATPLLVLASACAPDDVAMTPEPPDVCAAAWSDPTARALLDTLAIATTPVGPFWGDWEPGESHVVLYAGPATDSTECYARLQGGAVRSYAALPEPPVLRTPLYGYHIATERRGGIGPDLTASAAQPPAVSDWLGTDGVRSAVVMPVEPEDFPMSLPALLKAQLAVHEAFHVDVQGPTWMGHTSDWPTWDAQPDRVQTVACYSGSAEVDAAFELERTALFGVVEALLDGAPAVACERGDEFLSARAARLALVADRTVELADGAQGTCAAAETLLELEEGVADYASWVPLFERGLATRAQLERRYQAIQQEVTYLTGAMKMHAAALLTGDPLGESRAVAQSNGPSEGGPQARLERALEAVCSAGG